MQITPPPAAPQQPGRLAHLITRFMTLFFRLLYHSFAWAYDLVAGTVSLGRWQGWVLAAAGLLKGQRILELGFGPGYLQAHLRAGGKQVFGLDESAQMARMARRRLNRRRADPLLARGLAQALPYPAGCFDEVVATFPTPYIIHPDTLAEVRRVLRPGGRLVVLSAAWHTGKSLLERLMAFVFHITGESPPGDRIDEERVTLPFRLAGFDARIELVEVPGSRLLFIVAE